MNNTYKNSLKYSIQVALGVGALNQLGSLFPVKERQHKKPGSRKGCRTRKRLRRSIEEVYECLGDIYFRRAFRMTYPSFQHLHCLLKEKIDAEVGRNHAKTFYVHNGPITSDMRLGAALRYFAGGSPYDICMVFGISHTEALDSWKYVANAIHGCPNFDIEYPASQDEQQRIAAQFRSVSQADISVCAGAIDGILIWIERPSVVDSAGAQVDPLKFLCGRKHKHGLNCQAVADARGRFLDVSIVYAGSSSDLLAFEASTLYSRLQEDNFLCPGLCLFGDNAYLNSSFMATPYSGVAGDSLDAYNFYHSQLRIRVECAFGMLTQRWGILRSAMPRAIGIQGTISMVIALCKLHNFCIDRREAQAPARMAADEVNGELNGKIPLEADTGTGGQAVPRQLLHGGERVPRTVRRQHDRQMQGHILPREVIENAIAERGLRRIISTT